MWNKTDLERRVTFASTQTFKDFKQQAYDVDSDVRIRIN